jgi:hypothetical protein
MGALRIWHVARRLQCLRYGHAYHPIMAAPVEWCHRCGKTRPLQANDLT